MAQWQVVHTGGALNLVDGCFVSDSVGFAISNAGVVLRTTDQGTTWNGQTSLPGIYTSICKAGTDTVYAAGNYIYRSCDKGTTWSLVRGLGDTIADMIFFGSKKGLALVRGLWWCAGSWTNPGYLDDYDVYKSNDFGFSWQSGFNMGEGISHFDKINESVAYMFGGTSIVNPHCGQGWENRSRKTINQGTTWASAFMPGPGSCMSMINKDTGYCVKPYSDQHHIWKTTNGTATFQESYSIIPDPSVTQCLFINEFDGYMKGTHTIWMTRSNGLTWSNEYTSTASLNHLFRGPLNFLFAIGPDGTILKKQFIESTHPDTIYRVTSDISSVNFGPVMVNTDSIKQLPITNTGNITLTLTVATSDPFGISLNGSSFGNSVSVTVAPMQSANIYVQFAPPVQQNYQDSIVISADSLDTMRIPVSGAGFVGLVGTISHDTVICTDTVRINSNVKVEKGVRVTICPGTFVKFMGKYRLNVEGILDAMGDSLHNIMFGLQIANTRWNSIYVNNPDYNDTTRLTWCRLSEPCDSSAICIQNGNVSIDHCTISNKPATGVRALGPHSKLEIKNSIILNTSRYAVEFSQSDSSTVIDSYIYSNANGIFSTANTVTEIRGNQFYDNTATAITGGGQLKICENKIFSNNEGIHFTGSKVFIENNEIHHHFTQGIYCNHADSAFIRQNKIYYNYNGGISIAGPYVLIENNEIFNNTARGIYCEIGARGCYILQNVVFNNQTLNWLTGGGGISLINFSSGNTTCLFTGNTVCNNNDFGHQSELYVRGKPSSILELNMFNNIFYNIDSSMSQVAWDDYVACTFENNCVNRTLHSGQFNVSEDPEFVSATPVIGVTSNLGNYDWSLTNTSPCINKGDTIPLPFQPELDFAGNPRVFDGCIDIGAYEFQDTIAKPGSVSEIGSMHKAFVYPNPTTGILNVVVNMYSQVEIILYDVSPRKVFQQKFSRRASINLQQIEKGIYFYEVRDDNGLLTSGKIVKE